MKVLVLSQHFWPETFRINEVVLSLRDAGCDVCVLTGQPNYPDGIVFPGYRAGSAACETYDRVPVYRVPMLPRGNASAIRLVGNYLSFLISASVVGPWLLRRKSFDIVFVYGTSPILQVMPAIVMRLLKGSAVVTWVQDLWPQSLEVTGYVRNARLLAMVAAVVRWLYRRCDLLLVQSRGFVDSVALMAGDTPIEVHPNPGEVAFSERLNNAPAFTLQPGFNVVFAGNLGTVQALDTILEAAELLKEDADLRFVLVGSGNRGEALSAAVRRKRLTNVLFAGRFAPQAMPGILSQASALLVSLKRDPILAQTIPSKVQAYLAAGRPIIASLDGEGARVVCEAGAGVACPAEDAKALAQAVRHLRRCSAQELALMGQRGQQHYRANFDPQMLAQRLVRRFERLMNDRAAGATAAG